jgi:tetratricopeptide (TPR) repeat protein
MLKTVCLAVCCVVTLCASARGEKSKRQLAQELYESGMKHYNLREYADALTDFKEGYRTVPRPEFLFNIAQCHRQLAQYEDAEAEYRAYLREMPGTPNRLEVERLMNDMAEAQKKQLANKPPTGTKSPGDADATTAPLASPPPQPVVMAAPTVAKHSPAKDRRTYKKWWVWVSVSAVAAVALGVGLGVGLSQSSTTYPMANTKFGTVQW